MKHYNIPIFVPHEGCPHDCIFCNQRKITGMDTSVTGACAEEIIEEHLKTLPSTDRFIEAAFFGGSFTGISEEKQCELLEAAYKYKSAGKIDGIRLSTRPDCISEEVLERLARFGVTTVELGVQSMNEEVLEKSLRGHTAEDVKNAVCLMRRYPFEIGLQMMTGLPGDNFEKSIETAKKIIALKPDFVRIYPTLVLKDTALCRLYETGEYAPQELSEAVGLCKELLKLFKAADIPVIRVALATTDEISPTGSVVAGPFHSAFRELCEGELYYEDICNELEKAICTEFFVNPAEISRAVGISRRNIIRIKEKYGIDIRIKADDGVLPGEIKAGRNEI